MGASLFVFNLITAARIIAAPKASKTGHRELDEVLVMLDWPRDGAGKKSLSPVEQEPWHLIFRTVAQRCKTDLLYSGSHPFRAVAVQDRPRTLRDYESLDALHANAHGPCPDPGSWNGGRAFDSGRRAKSH